MSLGPPVDDSFYRKILALEDRLSQLQLAAPGAREQVLEAALEELKSSLEELHVAHEELQHQNRELEETRYALEEERQRYQVLFDLAPDGYLVTDLQGVVREANQAMQALFGLPPQFLVGKPLALFIVAEDQGDFYQQLRRLEQLEQATEFELRMQGREGVSFPARFTVNPVRDTRGNLTGLRWLVHDNSQRNLVEAMRIRQRVSEMSHISQAITTTLELPVVLQEIVSGACNLIGARYGALGVFNADGDVEQFVTHGISPEERERIGALPQGKGLLGWLHQHQEPLRLDDLSRDPRSVGFPPHHPPMKTFLGVPVRFNHQVLANLYITEKLNQQPFTQEDEDIMVLFAAQSALAINNALIFQSEQQAHRTIQEDQQRLRALVDTSPTGIFVVAADGEVLLSNREVERILGVPQHSDLEAYESAAVYKRPDGSVYQREEMPLQRALSQGEHTLAEEVRFEMPDGRSVLTLVSATPVFAADGQIAEAIAVFQDITPLEEFENLRNEFLGMVSHELRTPLTAIKGAAATALGSRHPLDLAETREFFQIIDEEADHLSSLVNNLLDVTRIESGTLSVNLEPVEVPEVLQDAIATFSRSGANRQVEVLAPPEVPPVRVDQRRISQVLVNLLSNAAKFSPPSAPIRVRVGYDARFLTFQVSDQGQGFSAEHASMLFQKFSRLPVEGNHHITGSGLGLAICRGIVEAHGGRICAESPGVGQGATFIFTIPVSGRSPTTRAHQVGQPAQPPDLVSRPDSRTHILAVDDDRITLRYLRGLLEEAGYRVTVTRDQLEFLRRVELERPDLIFTDLMMPGMSGFELLERVREFSGVPVICLTGRDLDEDLVRALQTGADDYITKPFSTSELLARVETVLRRKPIPGHTEVREPLVLDELTVDFVDRRVTVGGKTVTLSATEYRLLFYLASNAGRVLSHEQIIQSVWGQGYAGSTDLLRSMLRNLRRKLGDNARQPCYILTQPGVGYYMAAS